MRPFFTGRNADRLMLSNQAFLEAVDFAISGASHYTSLLHGDDHWRAVASQGLLISEMCNLGQAGRTTAALFGLFHDCRRENDDWDPEHGLRGASAFSSCPALAHLPEGLRDALSESMKLHDGGETTDDPLVGLGWDADRSTLGRVGIVPSFAFFSCVEASDFDRLIVAGAAATRAPMSWDDIWAAAFT